MATKKLKKSEIKKKKCTYPDPPDEGIPIWMATFADMMTLLFAFFVLLFSMSTLDPVKYSAFQKLTMDQTTIDWIITDNFRNNIAISCDPTMHPSVCHEVRYQHRGHAIYIEIADLFGWDAIYKTHKVFYDEWKINTQKDWGFMGMVNGNQISDDELILAASNAKNVNMAPLFHFWGRQPSEELANQLKNLPESKEIYCRLEYYKSMAPTDLSSFQTWYDANYVSVGGVQQVRYDYAINNFDTDNYGSDIQAQINLIINTYFSSEIDCNPPPLYIENNFSNNGLYPNPVNNKLSLDLTKFSHQTVNLSITDLSGKKMNNISVQGGKVAVLDVSKYNSGIYLIRIKQRKKKTLIRFIKN